MLRRARVLLRDVELAQDAVQNACLSLLRGGAAFRDAKEPLAYLYRSLDRAAFDILRTRRRKPLDGKEPDVLDGLAIAPCLDPWMRLATSALLESLDDDERELAVMAFVDGLDQGEIAERLGVSRPTVNKRVQGLRERARAFVPKSHGGHP
jgi:RNA polymerase sigma factor (sigma-70 family)